MDEDWESEIYGDLDFADFYREVLERETAGTKQPDADSDTPPQREQTAPRAGQRQAAAGRHASHAQPQPQTRRTQPQTRKPAQRRRKRKPRLRWQEAFILVLVVGALTVFLVSSLTVSRVKGFTVAASTASQQVLSWEKTGGVDGYEIYDSAGTLLAQLDAYGDTQYAVTGLQGGTQYTYTIVAVENFLGKHSSKASTCSAYTLPESVSSLSATASGTGVLLTWADSGASGYEVRYTDGAGVENTMEASSGSGFTISDLQEGSQYIFQVRGFVQTGDSRIYSDWISSDPITAVHTADMSGVDVSRPMVALTFDDGPDYDDVTERILDALKEYNGHATFFQLGNRAADLPELMTRIASEGHEIACHTYDHSHYGSDVTSDDIVRGDDAIEQASGIRPVAFRSPGGSTTDQIRETCRSEGMPIFYWSLDTEDWRSLDADAVYDAVVNNVSDGDIILMHNIYSSTADAVERIVPYLVQEGYQLVTVHQLVQAKTGNPPVPGTQYYTATYTD